MTLFPFVTRTMSYPIGISSWASRKPYCESRVWNRVPFAGRETTKMSTSVPAGASPASAYSRVADRPLPASGHEAVETMKPLAHL